MARAALSLLLVTSLAGCGTLFASDREVEPPRRGAVTADAPPADDPPPGAVASPRRAPAAPRDPPAQAGPCDEACRHILALTAPETAPAAASSWLAACRAACLEHASPGQLACYGRLTVAEDLPACTVR